MALEALINSKNIVGFPKCMRSLRNDICIALFFLASHVSTILRDNIYLCTSVHLSRDRTS